MAVREWSINLSMLTIVDRRIVICRQANSHPEAFIAYLQSTLIVLANQQGANETLFNEMALRLDRKPSLDCAFEILNELHEKGIVR